MPTRRDAATVSHLFSAAAAAGPADPTPRTPNNKSDSSPRAPNSKHCTRSTRLTAMMATTLAGGGAGAAGSLEARKWAALVATIWIQAFTGTNFDFSAYSSDLKSVLGVSQVQLNYLAVASDMGKAVGWSSGLALLCLPLPVVLFAAAGMGLAGYGLQWLVITGRVSLPYFSVSPRTPSLPPSFFFSRRNPT